MRLNKDPPSFGNALETDFKNLCRIVVHAKWAVRVTSTPGKGDDLFYSWCVGTVEVKEHILDLESAKAFVRLWGAHHNKEVGFTEDVKLIHVR